MKKRAADLPNSMSGHQLRKGVVTKLAKGGTLPLTLNQPVTGSSPVRLTIKLNTVADFPKTLANVAQCSKQPSKRPLNYQSEEF
jgi:hypothetical protein